MNAKLKWLKSNQTEVFGKMSSVLGLLASPVRLQIMHFLSQGPQSVEALASKLDQSVANTSMHLRKMLSEKIVRSEIQAQKRIYAFSHPSLFSFWEELQDFTQGLGPGTSLNVEKVYGHIDWGHDEKETRHKISKGEVIVLDVRPKDEVQGEHFKNLRAYLHIPFSDLKNERDKLPKDKDVLVFCRGRLCALGASAVNILREEGVRAFRLKQSWYSINKSLCNGPYP